MQNENNPLRPDQPKPVVSDPHYSLQEAGSVPSGSYNNPGFDANPTPQKKSKSYIVLAIVTLIAFCVVAFSYALFFYLSSMAQRGMSGTEFIALALWPVLMTVPFLSVIGLVTGAILTFKSHRKWSRLLWAGISLLLLAVTIHQAIGYVAESERSEEHNRVLGRDETVALIKACEVTSISKNMNNDGKVYLMYKNNYDKNGEWNWRPNNADGSYYTDYVKAAKEFKNTCGEITYMNSTPGEQDDPTGLGHRWIGVEEAKQVLLNCEINTFNYGPITLSETPKGTNSGIALIDHGWVKHLYVYPQHETELVSVVPQAKSKCGAAKPQIWNGSYERI